MTKCLNWRLKNLLKSTSQIFCMFIISWTPLPLVNYQEICQIHGQNQGIDPIMKVGFGRKTVTTRDDRPSIDSGK